MAGEVSGILGQVLKYMDRPWKVLAIIGLLILGGVGGAIWREQSLIEQWWRGSPTLISAELASIFLEELKVQTNADFVSLWSINLGPLNIQRMVATRRRGGENWVFRPERIPAILQSSDPKRWLRIVDGQPVCDVPVGDSLLIQRIAQDGNTWVCIIPVNPASHQVIGLIYMAWKEHPDKSHENAFLAFAHYTARQLIDKNG